MKVIKIPVNSNTTENDIDMLLLDNLHEEDIEIVFEGLKIDQDKIETFSKLYNIPMEIIA